MPPFVLLSLVGPAIALHNNETLHGAFPDRFYVSPALERVVAARKASYYGPDGALDPEVEALLETPADPVVLTPEEVRTRVLTGLADEARRMLDEGVVVGRRGPRPGDDHRRRVLVLERRPHHAARARGPREVPLTLLPVRPPLPPVSGRANHFPALDASGRVCRAVGPG